MTRFRDDELIAFEADGTPAFPPAALEGTVVRAGVHVWYAAFGSGPTVVLLHGGMGHSGNWTRQIPALVEGGYRVVVVDTRGHGRSSRDDAQFSYREFAADVEAVLNAVGSRSATFVGWSDGACTALVLAHDRPELVDAIVFFACNVDASGTHESIEFSAVLQRCVARHRRDYEALSPSPHAFDDLARDLQTMQREQPNYTEAHLARIACPVWVFCAESDEFIRPDHARWIADSVPNGKFVFLPQVSHFAPLQRPDEFNLRVLEFLDTVSS